MATWARTRWSVSLYTAPSVEPLTYSEIAALLQRGDSTHQTWLTAAIVAARAKVEQDTGLRLIHQTVDLTFDAFPEDAIYMPVAPLSSVTSIVTVSVAGASSTLSAANYQVDASAGRITLADSGTWPGDIRAAAGITVRAVVGYGAAGSSVPRPLLTAMEQLIAQWFAQRVGDAYAPPVPPRWMGYDALLAPYRRQGIG